MEQERNNWVCTRYIKGTEAVPKQISIAYYRIYLGNIHLWRSFDEWTKKGLDKLYEQPGFSEIAFRLGYSSMGPFSSPLENDKTFPSHLKNW